jgi:hypothetical protein
MSSTTHTLPSFMRRMTPDKFKAMSKEEQRAYDQKTNAWLKKFDASIDQRNAENHKTLAFGFAQLVQLDPAVEVEIVHNYLKRENRVMVDKDFADTDPAFIDALAKFELEKTCARARSASVSRSRNTGAGRSKRAQKPT